MSDQATIDPGLHVVSILGRRITGFAGENGYSSTMVANAFEVVVGNLGLAAFTRIRSGHAVITLELMPTSDDNDFLSLIHSADLTGAGGLVPLAKTLANGRTVEAGAVRIQKMPDTTQSNAPIVWTLLSANFVKFVGGYEKTPVFTTLEALQAAIAAAPPIPAPV